MIELCLALTSEQIDALAGRVALRLSERGAENTAGALADDGWLDTKHAAAYLGLSVCALHKLTAARAIPFDQAGPGCRCWFKRSALDVWVHAGRPSTRALRSAA